MKIMHENCGVKKFITNKFNNLLPVGLLHVAQLVECCTRITEVKGLNLLQAWIFSGFLSTNAKSFSLHNRCFMSQLKWMQPFAWSAKRVRSTRRGEKKNIVPVMHGSILLVTIPPPPPLYRQPLGNVQPFRPSGGIVWSSPVQGAGVLFDFVKQVLFLTRFKRWLRTSRLHIFKQKCTNLSESDWRGVTYQNYFIYLKVCFKIWNECVHDAYSNGF